MDPDTIHGIGPANLIDEVRAILAEFHPAGQQTLFGAFAEADLRDVLPRIAVPTLLLSGDKDVRSPLSVAEELHARIPGSKLVVIPGIGHLVDIEAADRFNAEVRSFLRSVRERAGGQSDILRPARRTRS